MQSNNGEMCIGPQQCELLADSLGDAIDVVMKHIFQGKCRTHQELEILFKNVNQAVVMRDLLNRHHQSIVQVSEEFLCNLEQWLKELQSAIY